MNVLNLNSCGNLKHGTKYIKDMKTTVGETVKTMWKNPTTDVSYPSQTYGKGTVPSSVLTDAKVDKVRGKSEKFNQLVRNGNFESTSGWRAINCSITINNNVVTFTASAKYGGVEKYGINLVQGHKYYCGAWLYATSDISGASGVYFLINDGVSQGIAFANSTINAWQTVSVIYTSQATVSNRYVKFQDARESNWDTVKAKNAMLVDLTAMYGAGNEPSTVEQFLSDHPEYNSYVPYDEGSVKSATLTSVVSKDTDNETLDTLTFPQTVTLRSAGSVSDEYNPETGVITRNTKEIIFDGTENWGSSIIGASGNIMQLIIPDADYAKENYNKPLCSHFKGVGNKSTSVLQAADTIGVWWNSAGVVVNYDNHSTDVSAFKTFLATQYANGTPVTVVYELATPTTEQLTPINPTIEVESSGTVSLTHTESPAVASVFDMEYYNKY